MRILLTIKYDGTDLVGFQIQDNGLTVQELIEGALFKLTGESIRIHGAGRTDSGVHAIGQTAHFDTDSRIPPEKYAYALNTLLPKSVRIAKSEMVDENFHARFSARGKHYRYLILNSPHDDPFLCRTALHVYKPLDLDRMNGAARLIVGTHDFSAFKAAGVELKTHVRTIYRSEFSLMGNSVLAYDIVGSGFMYNMVRILVGTFIEIGLNIRDIDCINSAFLSRNRHELGATAPARGLMLMEVIY
ncbi:MAG: tRNA pseudouridine(38-40) synthase TruA [Clostridia bacterium]